MSLDLRERLINLLGGFPKTVPLSPRTIKSTDCGDFIREKITYQVDADEQVTAFLCKPKNITHRVPAIVALHPHGGQYELGKSEVVGLRGNPEEFYALNLAKRGYVVIAADSICFEERQAKTGYAKGVWYERVIAMRELMKGGCMAQKMIWDIKREIDYLQTLDFVDPERIGCIGHSMGSMQAWFTSMVDERLKVIVCIASLFTYEVLFRDNIVHCFFPYIPNLITHGIETTDLSKLIAPRPFLIGVGKRDEGTPLDGVKKVYESMLERYRELGCEDRLKLVITEGGHEFSQELHEAAYAWLDKWLKIQEW